MGAKVWIVHCFMVKIETSKLQLWLVFWWSHQCSGSSQVQILSGQFSWKFLPWPFLCATATGFSYFFVESVVSFCKGSKFVTTFYDLREYLFFKKENRSLISSNSMISNCNTGSVVNVTFSVTSHRTGHSLRQNFANYSQRQKLARKLQINQWKTSVLQHAGKLKPTNQKQKKLIIRRAKNPEIEKAMIIHFDCHSLLWKYILLPFTQLELLFRFLQKNNDVFKNWFQNIVEYQKLRLVKSKC